MSAKAITASLAMLALTPLALADGTLEFEDLTDGTVYSPYQSFVTEGITVNVDDFNGNSGGSAQVESTNNAGAGQGMFVEVAMLDFQFPFPLVTVGFAYAHFGGDVRLSVNGVEVVEDDFYDFDNTTVGGANVTVGLFAARGGTSGYVTISGNITQFAFGSEDGEFDDVRYVTPTPGAAIGMLGFGALSLSRRRR